jgi:hypothetical protein
MRKMAQQYVENQTQALQDKIEKLGGAKLALSQRLVIVTRQHFIGVTVR